MLTNNKFNLLIKIGICVLLIFIYTLFYGCAHKECKIEYTPVDIPQLCDIKIPEKPIYTGDVVIDNINITRYTESLFAALKACVR